MGTKKHIQVIIKWGQYEPGYWYGSADKKMVANIQLKKIGAHAGKYLCSFRILSGHGVEPAWYHLGYYDTLADAKRKVSSKIREASTPIGYRPPSGKRRSAPQRGRKATTARKAHRGAKRAARGSQGGHTAPSRLGALVTDINRLVK